MSSEEKIMESGEGGVSSHDTPQAITIHIMAPSNLETTSIDSALVASVEPQDGRQEDESSSLLVVPADGDDAISVGAKNILETVTETHIGSEDLAVISNVSSDHGNEQTIELVTKSYKRVPVVTEELEEDIGCHCLICNEDLQDNTVSVFKSFTTSTQRKVSVFLGIVVGQKLTSRKAHSTIICEKCYKLLNKLDLLEVEIKTTKEEIVNKYQETVASYGGRARRKKPAAAKKSDYVFPKIEPEEREFEVEGEDDTYEPKLEDLMEEEHDQREDRDSVDEEWEPDIKRAKIKREPPNTDPSAPPKRKRGRPRKDAAKSKAQSAESKDSFADDKEGDDPEGHPSCPVCEVQFSFPSQVRRHIRHEHPDFDPQDLPKGSLFMSSFRKDSDLMLLEMSEDNPLEDQQLVLDLACSWCDKKFTEKEDYDEHLKEHGEDAFKRYMGFLGDTTNVKKEDTSIEGSSEGNDEVSIEAKIKNEEANAEKTARSNQDSCSLVTSLTCKLCGQQCLCDTSLREHLVHHFHGVKLCPLCPIRFTTRHHLISHVSTYHPDCGILCKSCNECFDTYHLYEIHFFEHHIKNAVRVCDFCKEKVVVFDYYKHMEEHSNPLANTVIEGPHVCNICGRRFHFSAQLFHHRFHKHPEVFSFKCEECERGCRTERLLSLHKWGHKYGSHQCPVCRLKFRQVDQLKRHLIVAHPDQESLTCKYCPLTLKNYATYIAHCKFKHPKESGYDRPVKCKICGRSFDHKMQWKYHMRDHCSQDLKTCRICGIRVKNLEIHMNLHTKSKKFECSICGAVYHNKASFHFHMKRLHMGNEVRKHPCDLCRKKFMTAADQRIHYSRVHEGERKYWCNICQKGYKSKVSLTYHERLHTGEKPHKCTLCDRTFRIPSYLQRHMEHEHRTQYTGVYFKQGRPKSQEARGQMRRKQRQSSEPLEGVSLGQTNGSIPEIVQITVPMEMGEEVVAAVNSVQNVPHTQNQSDQDSVVYLVYEKIG